MLAAMLAFAASPAPAEPPRVVRASPDHGEVGVDPTLREMRIEFDQDMSPLSRSICGGGPAFPIDTAPDAPAARWESARVIVVPLKLAASNEYRLSVNCPSARGFRSVGGEPARSTPIVFSTRAPGDPASAPPTREDHARAADRLARAIDQRYSYRDRLVKDWPERIAGARQELEGAGSPSLFARRAARLLEDARDPHVSLLVGPAAFGTDPTSRALNWSPRAGRERLKDAREFDGAILVARLDGDIAYVRVPSWTGAQRPIDQGLERLAELSDARAVIVDVRMNSGGNEDLAARFASAFARKATVYSRSVVRDSTRPGGFTEPIDRVLRPREPAIRLPVAVLIGPACMSSNESFIEMMKHGADATLIGEATAGSSGNPKPHDLGNGVTLLLPSWRDLLPDGTELEGRGITPDRVVRFDGAADADAVLDAAIEHLRSLPGAKP